MLNLIKRNQKRFPTNQRKIIKICVLGSSMTGKSSIINQFIKSTFLFEYDETIENRQSKIFKNDGKLYDLRIYDTAGSNDFFVTDLSQCDGFIIVYSLTDRYSLQRIQYYKSLINKVFNEDVPIVLVGNKMDQTRHIIIKKNEVKRISDELGLQHQLVCTSKSKDTITPIFKKVIDLVLNKEKKEIKQLLKSKLENSKIEQINNNNNYNNNHENNVIQLHSCKEMGCTNNEKLDAKLGNKPRSESLQRMKKYLTLF